MDKKHIIIRAAEVVGIILSLAGGFLANVAPVSDSNIWLNQFALGLGFLIILIVLLFIWGLTLNFKDKFTSKKWNLIALISFVVFFINTIYYFSTLSNYTIKDSFSQSEYVIRVHGDELTNKALKWKQEQSSPTKAEMMHEFAYIYDAIWTDSSTRQMEVRLLVIYLLMIMSLSLVILSLSEGALRRLNN